MHQFLQKLFGRTQKGNAKGRKAPRRSRLGGWESLEDRRLMACMVVNASPVLNITCNAANDTVLIRDDGNNMVTGAATGFGAFAAAGINQINVGTGGGDDRVVYDAFAGLLPFEQRTVNVSLGRTGNDRFEAYVRNDLRFGSSLSLNAYGYAGNDVMLVDASADVDVAANARLRAVMYGHDGNDQIFMRYHGENDGAVWLREANGGAGDDIIRAHLWEDAGSTGSIWGQEHGEDGNDIMSLFVITPNAGNKGAIFGGPGVDALAASANVTVFP